MTLTFDPWPLKSIGVFLLSWVVCVSILTVLNPCEMGPWLTMLLVKIMVQPRFNHGSSTVIRFLYMVLWCRPWWNMVHHADLLLTMVFHGKTWLSYLTMVQFLLTMVIMIICWCIMGMQFENWLQDYDTFTKSLASLQCFNVINRKMDIYSYFYTNVST